MTSLGDTAQIRALLEQAIEATIVKVRVDHPELYHPKEPPIHPLVKWLVGAIAAFGSAALIGLGFWLVSSVSQMQVTLARMDERMVSGNVKDARVDDVERRVTKLETYHQGGGK